MASLGVAIPPARRAEVEAAEKLADEEDVGASGDLCFQRRVFAELGVGDGRAQVGEAAQGLADGEQAGLGALVRRERVELVVAHGAEKNGVGLKAQVDGGLRAAVSRSP